MRFRFRTLGGVSLEGPHGPVTGRATQHRRLAVLSLLAAAPSGTSTRDKILGRLWPDTDQGKARHLLSDALYALRKALGDEAIVSFGDEELRLGGNVVWTDIGAFEAALDADDLEEAVGLYRGPFLDGFHVRQAPVFERWQERQARRLGSLYGEALERLANRAEAESDPETAVGWWKKRAAHDPYDSRIAHALMCALASAGNPAAAIRHARVHELMLRDELGLEPSDEVRELVESLRRETGADDDAETSGAGSFLSTEKPEGVGDPVAIRPRESDGAPAESDGDTEKTGTTTPLRSSGSSRWEMTDSLRWVAAGATAILAVGFGATFLLSGSGSSGEDANPRRGVLAAFENHTSQPNLGRTVTEAVRIDLSQSRSISLVEPSFVRAVLQRMQRVPDAFLDLEAAREVAVREGLETVVGGEVHSAGAGYVLTGKIVEAKSGRLLAGLRENVSGTEELIGAIDRLSKELRKRIGESVASVREAEPLERATTPSVEALEYYTRAVELFGEGERFETVKRLLEEAIALDSTFALAYRKLSAHLGNGNRDPAGRVTMARKAYRHRHGLPDRERLFIEGWYHMHVTGDYEKATAVFETLVDRYPAHRTGLFFLARFYGPDELPKAQALLERAIRLDSLSSAGPYLYLMSNLMDQGKFDAAWRVQEAQEHHFGVRHLERGWIAAAEGDYDRALREQESLLEGARGAHFRSVAYLRLGFYAATVGRIRYAEEATREAIDAAERAGRARAAIAAALQQARVDLEVMRDTAGALDRVDAILDRHPLDGMDPVNRLYLRLAGLYAQAGRTGAARELLREEEKTRDPAWRPDWRARHRRCVLALAALSEGRPDEAISGIEALDARESWGHGPCAQVLPHRPVLARAHEAAGRPDSAIAYYEGYLAHPRHYRDWWHPIYLADVLERLAVLYEARGDLTKAANTHGRLVKLWEDCEPELRPRVERARARAVALRDGGGPIRESAVRP